MPYIDPQTRLGLDPGYVIHPPHPEGPGELNYVITTAIDRYVNEQGELNYAKINEVIGVLECAKLELYRRVAAPYEDQKMNDNGEVYTCQS